MSRKIANGRWTLYPVKVCEVLQQREKFCMEVSNKYSFYHQTSVDQQTKFLLDNSDIGYSDKGYDEIFDERSRNDDQIMSAAKILAGPDSTKYAILLTDDTNLKVF